MTIRSAILVAATVAAGVVLPAASAAACDPAWEKATGFCNRCTTEAWAYHTADDAALDLLPDAEWRCAP